jgi:probable rRNA maturation factor
MSAPGDSTPCMLADSEASRESEPSGGLTVAIVNEQGDWGGFDGLDQAIDAAASALGRHRQAARARGAEASVVLADDRMVRGLNATYRGKDAPTNVLSFPFQTPPGGVPEDAPYLGDVVLAAETIAREAAERGIAPTAHLQHLVVHGLLHLLGFDHATDVEAEQMERIEIEILARLGIADPYAEPLA